MLKSIMAYKIVLILRILRLFDKSLDQCYIAQLEGILSDCDKEWEIKMINLLR